MTSRSLEPSSGWEELLERCACCRLQMDLACDLWVPVGSGRSQDVV